MLVSDAWLANAGDAAIATALQKIVLDLAPDAAVLHASYQHDLVGALIPALDVIPPLEALLGTPWSSPLAGWEDGLDLLRGADLVISQGGGFLMEPYQAWKRLTALADVVRHGRPLCFFGQTIGRYRAAPARRLLHASLAGAQLIVVRDPASIHNVVDLGASPDSVHLGTDLAFAHFDPCPAPQPARAGIGVVLSEEEMDPIARQERRALAHRVLAAVIDAASDEPIIAWSTAQGLGHAGIEDDGRLARDAIRALPRQNASRVQLVDGYVTPDEAIGLVSRLQGLVTMRMHPALFAAASGTPWCLIHAGQKLRVLEDCDLLGRIHPERSLTSEASLRSAVATALEPVGPAPAATLAPVIRRLASMRQRLRRLIDAG